MKKSEFIYFFNKIGDKRKAATKIICCNCGNFLYGDYLISIWNPSLYYGSHITKREFAKICLKCGMKNPLLKVKIEEKK